MSTLVQSCFSKISITAICFIFVLVPTFIIYKYSKSKKKDTFFLIKKNKKTAIQWNLDIPDILGNVKLSRLTGIPFQGYGLESFIVFGLMC